MRKEKLLLPQEMLYTSVKSCLVTFEFSVGVQVVYTVIIIYAYKGILM